MFLFIFVCTFLCIFNVMVQCIGFNGPLDLGF
jgi:hypothetical protein